MIDPVKKEISVPVTPSRAFDIFTKDIAKWWPLQSHSLSGSAGKLPKDVVVTPGIGGTIKEEMFDGSTANWGIITHWEPGIKLEFTWDLRRPETEQTHVSIAFLSNDTGTQVCLVHSGWDSQIDDGKANRENYNSGWDIVLERFVAQALS